jgi:hypothetical protein
MEKKPGFILKIVETDTRGCLLATYIYCKNGTKTNPGLPVM